MFLNVYARWIREADKGTELSKLETILKGTSMTAIENTTQNSHPNQSKCGWDNRITAYKPHY